MFQVAQFIISYQGEALNNHEMDVRDLAPALMSLGHLFDESNRALNQDKAEVKVQVKAVAPGSFELLFELSQKLSSQIGSILSGDLITNALTLKDLIFSGKEGLCWLLKKLEGQAPDTITDLGNGTVRIVFKNETYDIPVLLLRLYQDLAVRHAIEGVFSPLQKTGFEKIEIKDKHQSPLTVYKEELPYFQAPAVEDEIILQDVREIAFSIVSLAFKEDNKWRLHDGNNTINAVIKDETFLRRVQDSLVSFSKGDYLICKVKITQKQTDTGLKTDYEIEEVIKHHSAARQLPLKIEPPEDHI
jgi:hypothetical protein